MMPLCPLCGEQVALVKMQQHKESCIKTRFAERKERLVGKYGLNIVQLFEKMLLGQMPTEPSTEIIPSFLYVGNFSVAKDEAWLSANKITHIINAASNECKPIPDTMYRRLGITCVKLPLEDCKVNKDLRLQLNDVMQQLGALQQNGGKVLLHCRQGVSRSALIACAYLIGAYKIDLIKALTYLNERRKMTPCIEYLVVLSSLEEEWLGKRSLSFEAEIELMCGDVPTEINDETPKNSLFEKGLVAADAFKPNQ